MARVDASGAGRPASIELNGTSTTPIIGAFVSSTDRARSGSRSWKGSIIGATGLLDNGFGTMDIPAQAQPFGTQGTRFFAINIDSNIGLSLGNPDINIFRLDFGALNNITGRVVINVGAGTYTLTVTASDGVATSASLTFPGLPLDDWHTVTVRWQTDIAATFNVADQWWVRVDGNEQQGATVNFATNSEHSSFDFGILGQNDLVNLATDLDVFFDDIILDNSGAANQVGRAAFLTLIEPHDIDNDTNWVGFGNAGNSVRQRDNDDGTGHQLGQNLSGEVIRFNITDIPDGMPTAHLEIPAVYPAIRTVDNPNGNLQGDIEIRFRHDIPGFAFWDLDHVTVTNTAVPTTHRSPRVYDNDRGQPIQVIDINNLLIDLVGDTGLQESIRVSEVWCYVEMKVNVRLDEDITLSESVAITAEVAVSDALAVSESVDIEAMLDLQDTLSIAPLAPEIFAQLDLADTMTLSELASQVTFIREDLCQGGGSPIFIFED